MEERLQKILSHAGVASRRHAEEMIAAGRVSVDGEVVTALGQKFDALLHKIAVDSKPLHGEESKVYYLLNKPKGYLSTARDERGRKTVLDLLSEVKARIYPVGRLDYDTEGLLLITNDGALTQGLLHPRYGIEKTYRAAVSGEMTKAKLKALTAGILLDDGMTAPAKGKFLERDAGGRQVVQLTIYEGRNRQVRRMFEAVGCYVEELRRTNLAFLTLKGMKLGAHRKLTDAEVLKLKEIAGVKV